MKSKIVGTVILVCIATCANASLIRNPSFETVPNSAVGQGIMPSDWTTVQVTPDTYSNDGSYGLSPSDGGNFTGVTALDGIRWVAGWSAADERFGQTLSAPLIGGQLYTFSGYLIQAKRNDLDHTGGYELYLTDATHDISAGALLGNIGPTTNSDDWEFFSFTFDAPENANTMPFLLFKPFGDTAGGAYPGLDNVSLNAVPVPAAVWLFGFGLLGLIGVSRRKRST